MNRLFTPGKIKVESYGKRSQPHSRLAVRMTETFEDRCLHRTCDLATAASAQACIF